MIAILFLSLVLLMLTAPCIVMPFTDQQLTALFIVDYQTSLQSEMFEFNLPIY